VTFQILRLNDSIKMEEQFESTNYSMFTQRFENSANLFENTQSHTVLRLYYVGAPCPLAMFIFSDSLSLQKIEKSWKSWKTDTKHKYKFNSANKNDLTTHKFFCRLWENNWKKTQFLVSLNFCSNLFATEFLKWSFAQLSFARIAQ
jgi:hypothetical protein